MHNICILRGTKVVMQNASSSKTKRAHAIKHYLDINEYAIKYIERHQRETMVIFEPKCNSVGLLSVI